MDRKRLREFFISLMRSLSIALKACLLSQNVQDQMLYNRCWRLEFQHFRIVCGIICRLPFGAPRLRFSLEVMHPNARGPASGGSAALLYAVFSFCLLTLGGPAQALRRGLPLRHPSHPPVGRGPGVRLTHPSTWRQPVRYLLAPTLASTRIYCIRTTSLCMLCKRFLTLPGFSTRKVNILKCFPNAIR